MKLTALLALSLALPVSAMAADDAQQSLDAKAEACITAGAPAVAKTEPNLSSATEFLINDLCAREVELAGKYRSNRKVLDLLIKQQKTTMAMATPASTPGKPADGPAAAAPVDDKAQKAAAAKQAKLAGLEAARISPETGELEGLPGPYSMISDLANIVLGFRSPQASAEFRAFAAHAVLAAREATR